MEPQVDICFKKDKKRRCCVDLVIFIISILITLVLGIVVGALTNLVPFLGIGAVVVLLAILLILLLIRIIMLACNKKENCR